VPRPRNSLLIDEDDVIVRSKAGPRLRDLTLDAQEAEKPLASVGVDVLPVQRTGPLEPIGEQDRDIVDRWAYATALLGPTPLVREVVAELASRAFGIAALSLIAST
jgi:hypothetical protein